MQKAISTGKSFLTKKNKVKKTTGADHTASAVGRIFETHLRFAPAHRLFRVLPIGAEKVEAEKLGLILRIFTDDERLGDFATLNQFGQADQLAEFAFQVKVIPLAGNKIDMSFTLVKDFQKRRHINVMQFNWRRRHIDPSFGRISSIIDRRNIPPVSL
jgi:hypothetical protein